MMFIIADKIKDAGEKKNFVVGITCLPPVKICGSIAWISFRGYKTGHACGV
jgi:hypothetical protein